MSDLPAPDPDDRDDSLPAPKPDLLERLRREAREEAARIDPIKARRWD